MKCEKCGKEINDKAKFCRHCGSPVKHNEAEEQKKENDFEPYKSASKDVNKKKRITWTCSVVIIVLFIIGALVFYVKNGNNQDIKKIEQTENEKPEKIVEKKVEKEPKKEPEAVYPKDITLNSEVQNKVTELLDLLSKVDASGNGHNFAINRTIDNEFACRFLLNSMWFKVPFADGQAADDWSIPEDIVRQYLSTSIGVSDCTSEGISISDGMLFVEPVQVSGIYGNDTPQIIKVTQLSDTDIQVLGSVNYTPEFQDEPYTAEFDVTLTANPDSMWGGYTLKSINKWDETLEVQMKKFIEILGYCENASSWMADGKSLPEFNSAEFSKAFLWWAAKFDQINNHNEMEKKYACTVTDDGYCLITEENAEKFLMSSIGQYDNSTMDYRDDKIMSLLGNVGSSGVEKVNIAEITNTSDTDIKIDGSLAFHSEGRITRIVYFSITMNENPESIWSGYTLKSIDKWEEASKSTLETVSKQEFNISSSSTLQQSGYDYSVASLVDGDTQTCWAEGISGAGKGERVIFSSDETKTVSGLAILPGYFKSEDLFYKNGMPSEIKIICGDKSWTWNFYDFQPNFSSPMDSMVFIDFGEDVDMNECTVTLSDCKSGNKYDDICITEMFLYKK